MGWTDRWDERNQRTLDTHNDGGTTPMRRWVEWGLLAVVLVVGVSVVVAQGMSQGARGAALGGRVLALFGGAAAWGLTMRWLQGRDRSNG